MILKTQTSLTLAVAGLALLGLSPGRAQAATNALFFNDFSANPSGSIDLQALNALGLTTTVVGDQNTFATDLASGSYNLAILDVQGNFQTTAEAAMTNYVAGGGVGIAADWSGPAGNTTAGAMAVAFDANYTGGRNQTMVTAMGGTTLFTGVTSPLALVNPGYGIFSTSQAGSGSIQATFGDGTGAIVLGNSGRTIFNGFLSDTYNSTTQGDRLQLSENEINKVLGAPASTPEPSTIAPFAFLGLGLGGMLLRAKKRRALP